MGTNPFIGGSYRQRPGQQTPPERPDRVTPVPDNPEGISFPYRGTQNHGVAPTKGVDTDEYYETQQWQDGPDSIDPSPPYKDEDPVAVRIVQGETARELLDWRPVRFRVTDQPQQLVGKLDKRRSVRIKVHGFLDGEANTHPVYIGNDAGLRPYTGYEIAAGETIDPMFTTQDIWAIANAGTSVEVSVLYEFGIDLKA
jgi:hypothetical protein